MVIEAPEHPLNFPVAALAEPPLTIGRFYDAIKGNIIKLGDGIFAAGSPAKQLILKFGAVQTFKVTDVASAVRAIDLIVQQGEGTTTSPLDPQKGLAHYYRFAEIFHQKALVPNPAAPPGTPDNEKYKFDQPPIPFDPSGVWPVLANPKATSYAAGSAVRRVCDTFNYTYTCLLKSLQATFSGEPSRWQQAVGVMESLKQQAMDLMATDLGNGKNAGPSFEYQPINPG